MTPELYISEAEHCAAGDFVELRFEMHTLLVLSTCPHPLDPAIEYQPRSVRLNAWVSGRRPCRMPAASAAMKMRAAFAIPK